MWAAYVKLRRTYCEYYIPSSRFISGGGSRLLTSLLLILSPIRLYDLAQIALWGASDQTLAKDPCLSEDPAEYNPEPVLMA